jgi:hypothetical protein
MRHPVTRRGILAGGAWLGMGATVGAWLPRPAAADVLPGSYGTVSPYLVKLELTQRLPSLTRAEFLARWRDDVAPLYRGTPGLVRYVLNIADPDQSQSFAHDGAGEFWFESESTLRAAFDLRGNAAARRRVAAAARITAAGLPEFVSREIIIRELDATGFPLTKRIGLLKLPATETLDRFAEQWRDEHAPNVNKMGNLKGYRVNIVDARLSPNCPWAGFASLWWARDAAASLVSRPAAPAGNGDAFAPVSALVGEEIVIV